MTHSSIECRVRLSADMSTRQKRSEEKTVRDGEGRVKVGVRVRPCRPEERPSIDGGPRRVRAIPDAGVAVTYTFDRVFWPPCLGGDSSQAQVFERLAAPLVTKALAGYDACLFAYGQTGSGKTYSMTGPDPGQPGIVPRFIETLFREAAEQNRDVRVVHLSYYEIYNEKIYDLLAEPSDRRSLRVREHPVTGPYVENLSMRRITSYADARPALAEGDARRATASTDRNERSSRSHSVVQLIVQSKTGDASVRSKVSLVDLAGSERLVRNAPNDQRFKEGLGINKSLLTLGKVITCLSDSNGIDFVPYRESTLTWLLKGNLGKNSYTVMLATVSPESSALDETLSTLRYACRARRIINKVSVNEDPQSKAIRELKKEIARLKSRESRSRSDSDSEFHSEIKRLCSELQEAERRRKELETQNNLFMESIKTGGDGISFYQSDFFDELRSILDDSADETQTELRFENERRETGRHLDEIGKSISRLNESCSVHVDREVFNKKILPLLLSMRKIHSEIRKEIFSNDKPEHSSR